MISSESRIICSYYHFLNVLPNGSLSFANTVVIIYAFGNSIEISKISLKSNTIIRHETTRDTQNRIYSKNRT